jgi:EAL and modified HD-GYP domain-containing signal transduction protein
MRAVTNLSVQDPPVDGDPARLTRFLARQPILNARQQVVAYELLFRSGWNNAFSGDDDNSTRQILDSILVVGAPELCSGTRAFVNCTRDALVGSLVTLLPAEHTVLEVLETVKPDPDVVAACRRLKDMGYKLALDDFENQQGMGPLIEIADYIKIDFRRSDLRARKSIRSHLGGSRAALLAEKIEQQEEFAVAVGEGYEFFQGYFFSRPTMLARDEVPLNHLNSLGLLASLARSPLDHREIERLVLADAPLCFRLMRQVNSPLYGVRDHIDSVRRALIVLGEDEFRKLVTVAMAGILAQRQPHALVALSLQRARFCELLAPYLEQDRMEQYLIGLLSLVDAMLRTPMASLVSMLPLRPELRLALLGAHSPIAVPLCIARSYETGDWTSSVASREIFELGSELLNGINLASTRWAEAALQINGNRGGQLAL